MDISWWLNRQFNTWNCGCHAIWHLTNICFSYVLFIFFFLSSFPFGADVVAYATHVPSFADSWGWVMVCKKNMLHTFFYYNLWFFFYKISMLWIQASDQPILIDAVEMDKRIEARIKGKLLYLDGAWFHSSTIMNKTVSKS